MVGCPVFVMRSPEQRNYAAMRRTGRGKQEKTFRLECPRAPKEECQQKLTVVRRGEQEKTFRLD